MGKRRNMERAPVADEYDEPPRKANKKVSSSAQKNAITEFIGITQADKSSASKLLKQHNYNVQAAVNAFFSQPSSNSNNASRSALTKIFDKYRDSPAQEPDEINVEGVSSLLGDISVGLDDIGALVFSELVASPSLGKVEREGFLNGCASAGVDSIPKLKNIVLQRRSMLASDRSLFKNVYNHTYQLALQPGQKSLPLEMAVEFWKMVFNDPGLEWRTPRTPWLDWWLEFQEEKVKRSVNKDLWRQTLNFALKTLEDESLGFWSEESSWPSVIDEFVEWVKTEKRPEGTAANGDVMEE